MGAEGLLRRKRLGGREHLLLDLLMQRIKPQLRTYESGSIGVEGNLHKGEV